MAHVTKNLTALTWVIYPLALVIGISPIVFFWVPEGTAFIEHDLLQLYGGTEQLLMWQKLSGFFVACLPAVFLLWALSYLLRLIKALKSGLWFAEHSETLCRQFGKALMWYVGAQILHRTLLVLILTATYPPGKHELHLSFSNNDLMTLVPAIFAMIFAHIVSLGRAQRDELKQII